MVFWSNVFGELVWAQQLGGLCALVASEPWRCHQNKHCIGERATNRSSWWVVNLMCSSDCHFKRKCFRCLWLIVYILCFSPMLSSDFSRHAKECIFRLSGYWHWHCCRERAFFNWDMKVLFKMGESSINWCVCCLMACTVGPEVVTGSS